MQSSLNDRSCVKRVDCKAVEVQSHAILVHFKNEKYVLINERSQIMV